MARYIDADNLAVKWTLASPTQKQNFREIIEKHPTADVVPRSEEGAECPTCYGTGRIGTTNWLTKNMTKKQIAEEKALAIAEHEQYIKTEYAREIFEDLEKSCSYSVMTCNEREIPETKVYSISSLKFAELKKKYTEENK